MLQGCDIDIDEVVQNLNVGRCVGIHITNNTKGMTLRNPRTYCYSGYEHTAPTQEIAPGDSGHSVFVKTSGTARGSVGLLIYDLDTVTLAILFSNPFDYNLYPFELAVEIFPSKKMIASMSHIYNYMYSGGPPYECNFFKKVAFMENCCELVMHTQNLEVEASMTNNYKSSLKVQINEKDCHLC
ncbi:deep-sea actinoporin Cjtox I-like [Carettochelys insculpta]|uniref:deep-sea actinoporin Cjtox I-like n=1 Tax=Carettochelys insculpta TaxID=44489 RepID=UPI003EC05AD0